MAKRQHSRRSVQRPYPTALGALVLGLGLVGSGCDSSDAAKGPATKGEPATPTAAAPKAATDVGPLVSQADNARRVLDTAALQRVQGELGRAEANPRAQRARLEVLATLAIEARIRGATLGDAPLAAQAVTLAEQAQGLADTLTQAGALDPGALGAIEARIALARDEDVASEHPAVLLPTFRDRELQHAVLARSQWRPDEAESLDDDERDELITALQDAPKPSGLERLLLAVTLEAAGKTEPAAAVAREVLATAPGQPLAQGLLERIDSAGLVAVADPVVPTAKPEPEPTAKPEPSTAKPRPTSRPKLTPEELTTQGCKLVRSGDAKQGFSMLQRAFDLDPRDTKVTLCMAEGHMKLGRLPSARAMAERVLRSSPKNKKALLLAAKVEDRMGNKRAAVDYHRRVLAIDPSNSTSQSYVDANG